MDCYFQMGFWLFPDFFAKLENMSGNTPNPSRTYNKKTYSKHVQHISQICQNICQQMSRTYPTCLPDIWGTTFWGEIDFGENHFLKNIFSENIPYTIYIYIYIYIYKYRCDSCMVHQVWFMYGTWDAAAAAGRPGRLGATGAIVALCLVPRFFTSVRKIA